MWRKSTRRRSLIKLALIIKSDCNLRYDGSFKLIEHPDKSLHVLFMLFIYVAKIAADLFYKALNKIIALDAQPYSQ